MNTNKTPKTTEANKPNKVVKKKKLGRPKGSKNKPKKLGRPKGSKNKAVDKKIVEPALKAGRPARIKDAVITHFYISKKDNVKVRKWAKATGLPVAELTREFITQGLQAMEGGKPSFRSLKKLCTDRLADIDSKMKKLKRERDAVIKEIQIAA